MRSKIVLLGEAPNPATEGRPELWLRPDRSGVAHSANRLLEFTGYTARAYLELFERTNLLERCPPRTRTRAGREFPLDEARRAAVPFHHRARGRRVVVLGRRVASAFRWFYADEKDREGWRAGTRAPVLEWISARAEPVAGDFSAAIVPHPSGVNQWWNHETNRARARAFFAELLEER